MEPQARFPQPSGPTIVQLLNGTYNNNNYLSSQPEQNYFNQHQQQQEPGQNNETATSPAIPKPAPAFKAGNFAVFGEKLIIYLFIVVNILWQIIAMVQAKNLSGPSRFFAIFFAILFTISQLIGIGMTRIDSLTLTYLYATMTVFGLVVNISQAYAIAHFYWFIVMSDALLFVCATYWASARYWARQLPIFPVVDGVRLDHNNNNSNNQDNNDNDNQDNSNESNA